MVRAFDWLARTAMLLLAALATLALIGSLASVSDTPMAASFPGEIADVAESAPAAEDEVAIDAPTPSAEATATERRQATTITRMRAEVEKSHEIARWLKALTYAVIALAAIAAAGVVALVRIGGHVARVAER